MTERMVLARNIQAGDRIYNAGTPLSEVPGGDQINPKYVTVIVDVEPSDLGPAADVPTVMPGPPAVEVMETKSEPHPARPTKRRR
jgi:hypothetical protein